MSISPDLWHFQSKALEIPTQVINADSPSEVASEMEGILLGQQVAGWRQEIEVETTFFMSPNQFLAQIPPESRQVINPQRHMVDIIFKKKSSAFPDRHIKGRIRLDAATGYVPEIYVKIKGKEGPVKSSVELVRQTPCSDWEQLALALVGNGWVHESPPRERQRVSYMLTHGNRTAKIAFSLFTPGSTRYLTQMPWEADLEASQADIPYFTNLLGIDPDQLTSESFPTRELNWLRRIKE